MQQRSEETRGHILQAAGHLFARNGYDATGVAELCAAAGVSKGAFYHHFPSKQAVFFTLLEDWLAGLEPQIQAFLRQEETVPGALVAMTPILEQIFSAGQGQLPMFLEFWVQASRDPAVWQVTIAPYYRYANLFAGALRRGMQEGALRSTDPDGAARILMALAIGLIIQGLFDPDGANWEQVSRQGFATLIAGMQGEKQ